MSLPITAVGPLNVLTKPIFTLFCCAGRGHRREHRQNGSASNDCASTQLSPSQARVKSDTNGSVPPSKVPVRPGMAAIRHRALGYAIGRYVADVSRKGILPQ